MALTATGASPLRSVTFQPLWLMIHSTIAPTAEGSDLSIATPDTYRVAYGDGTGSARQLRADRAAPRGFGASSGACGACSVSSSPVITGANAAFTHAWISGTLRKLVFNCSRRAPCAASCCDTSR